MQSAQHVWRNSASKLSLHALTPLPSCQLLPCPLLPRLQLPLPLSILALAPCLCLPIPLQVARAFRIHTFCQVVPCHRLVAQPLQNHRCNGNHFWLTTCKILSQLQTSVLLRVVWTTMTCLKQVYSARVISIIAEMR